MPKFQFSGGGYSVLRLGLSDNFHFWGGILYSDLDSLTIFIFGGGYSVLRLGLSDNFHFRGGEGRGGGYSTE